MVLLGKTPTGYPDYEYEKTVANPLAGQSSLFGSIGKPTRKQRQIDVGYIQKGEKTNFYVMPNHLTKARAVKWIGANRWHSSRHKDQAEQFVYGVPASDEKL